MGGSLQNFMKRGDLVPDELVLQTLSVPVLEAAANGGYVLDGFPRTVHQAEEAYSVAELVEGVELQAAIHLRVSHRELLNRIRARVDHEGRSDDNELAIAHRFEVFDAETRPLLGFYANRGILVDINGEQGVQEVFADITAAIDGLRARSRLDHALGGPLGDRIFDESSTGHCARPEPPGTGRIHLGGGAQP